MLIGVIIFIFWIELLNDFGGFEVIGECRIEIVGDVWG